MLDGNQKTKNKFVGVAKKKNINIILRIVGIAHVIRSWIMKKTREKGEWGNDD